MPNETTHGGRISIEESVPDSLSSVTDPAARSWLSQSLRAHFTRLLVVVEIVVILLVWEWLTGWAGVLNPTFVPPPSHLFSSLIDLFRSGEILEHLMPSLIAWSVGLSLSLLIAVPFGVLMGRSYAVHRLAGPFIWSLYATPWLAYQPLSKVWFGFGLPPVIFLVFIAALFPTMLNTAAGVSTTSKSLLNAARVFGAGRAAILTKVVLPSSLPLMLAGIRQSVAMATIALIVAEMSGPSRGVGTLIITKTQARMVDEAFVGILVAVAWTLLMTTLAKVVGERLAPWQRDARV